MAGGRRLDHVTDLLEENITDINGLRFEVTYRRLLHPRHLIRSRNPRTNNRLTKFRLQLGVRLLDCILQSLETFILCCLSQLSDSRHILQLESIQSCVEFLLT